MNKKRILLFNRMAPNVPLERKTNSSLMQQKRILFHRNNGWVAAADDAAKMYFVPSEQRVGQN